MSAGRPLTRHGVVRITQPVGVASTVAFTLGGSVAPNGTLLDVALVAGTNTLDVPADGTFGPVTSSDPNGVWAVSLTPPAPGPYVAWVRRRHRPRVAASAAFVAS